MVKNQWPNVNNLQRDPKDRLGWPTGLEPATTGTTIRGSTIELRPPYQCSTPREEYGGHGTPKVTQVVHPPSRFYPVCQQHYRNRSSVVGAADEVPAADRVFPRKTPIMDYDCTLISPRKCTDQPNCPVLGYFFSFSRSLGFCLLDECLPSLCLRSTRFNATRSGLGCPPLRPGGADLWVKQ